MSAITSTLFPEEKIPIYSRECSWAVGLQRISQSEYSSLRRTYLIATRKRPRSPSTPSYRKILNYVSYRMQIVSIPSVQLARDAVLPMVALMSKCGVLSL
jgi:hypothetical protein